MKPFELLKKPSSYDPSNNPIPDQHMTEKRYNSTIIENGNMWCQPFENNVFLEANEKVVDACADPQYGVETTAESPPAGIYHDWMLGYALEEEYHGLGTLADLNDHPGLLFGSLRYTQHGCYEKTNT